LAASQCCSLSVLASSIVSALAMTHWFKYL
jgi:hypothetical protein